MIDAVAVIFSFQILPGRADLDRYSRIGNSGQNLRIAQPLTRSADSQTATLRWLVTTARLSTERSEELFL
jgi:hypothetical protein